MLRSSSQNLTARGKVETRMVKKQREREREKESEQTVVDVAKGVGREGWPPLPDGGGEHEARGLGGLWLLLALVSSKGWENGSLLRFLLPRSFLLPTRSRIRCWLLPPDPGPAAPQFSRAGEHRAVVSGTTHRSEQVETGGLTGGPHRPWP